MKNFDKVLISGGAGFIGSNLSEELIKEGYEVHVIDIDMKASNKLSKDVKVHNFNIYEKDKLDSLMRSLGSIDSVFHLAALPRVQSSIEDPTGTSTTNIMGTINLLDLSTKVGAKRFIYSSSSAVYADSGDIFLKEDSLLKPKSPYGLQKYVGELFVKLWSEIYGLDGVSLRYFNVYGPNMDPNGPYALVLGKFLKQKKDKNKLTITGDGTQTRDFVHVSDVVQANILAMKSSRKFFGEAINIGSGKNISINKLADLVGGEVEYIESREEPHDTKADNKKAMDLLGWEPKISLKEGIENLKKKINLT